MARTSRGPSRFLRPPPPTGARRAVRDGPAFDHEGSGDEALIKHRTLGFEVGVEVQAAHFALVGIGIANLIARDRSVPLAARFEVGQRQLIPHLDDSGSRALQGLVFKLSVVTNPDNVNRVIPAWAGNTCGGRARPRSRPGHPRMGGEHADVALGRPLKVGSSPHGRGTQNRMPYTDDNRRVIPAWAGNTADRCGSPGAVPGHPRMGGEHVCVQHFHKGRVGSSPHGRGTPISESAKPSRVRVIPAWAGNTSNVTTTRLREAGHPRMGGEHRLELHTFQHDCGSSPHGRGTRRRVLVL